MATFEELRQQLSSSNWEKRRDAVRALAQMTDRRDEVIPLLKERLRKDDYNHVIGACVEELEQLGALDDEVFNILRDRINDDSLNVREEVVPSLTRFASTRRADIIQLLKERLRKDKYGEFIRLCMKELRGLGALNDEIINILQSRIRNGEFDVIRDCIKELERPGALDKKVIPLLKERLRNDNKGFVVEECIKGLEKLGALDKEVTDVLKMRLQRDGEFRVIEACIDGLVKMGMSINELTKLLSRNPNLRGLVHRYAEGYRSRNARAVFETGFRNRWWALPAEVRRSFSVLWHWHHCPECHKLFHEIFPHHLRHGGRRQEIEWLLHRLAHRFGEPRWGFTCHDFETLMGLHVWESAYYEEVNILRFRFLDAFATDPEGRPIRDWIRKTQENWDEILETEDHFDRLRDEVSELKRK